MFEFPVNGYCSRESNSSNAINVYRYLLLISNARVSKQEQRTSGKDKLNDLGREWAKLELKSRGVEGMLLFQLVGTNKIRNDREPCLRVES